MIIVLIHWKIIPNKVDEFLEFWRKTAVVQDRRGLIGEFLSEAYSTVEYSWITWQLTGSYGKYHSFINVGLWNNAEDFHEQIGRYFESSSGKREFEYEPRIRTVLGPRCWRVGDSSLPQHDSSGVL
jgi:hypothetical protein